MKSAGGTRRLLLCLRRRRCFLLQWMLVLLGPAATTPILLTPQQVFPSTMSDGTHADSAPENSGILNKSPTATQPTGDADVSSRLAATAAEMLDSAGRDAPRSITSGAAAAASASPPMQPSSPDTLRHKKKETHRKISLIKRDFNFREQVIVALGMMFFVVLMMNTAQALNPE